MERDNCNLRKKNDAKLSIPGNIYSYFAMCANQARKLRTLGKSKKPKTIAKKLPLDALKGINDQIPQAHWSFLNY